MKAHLTDSKDSHQHFQLDLSCLLDGELDEAAAARAMLHIEECEECRAFFQDIREQLHLHRDARDPDRLVARVAMLTGHDVEGIDLVHRLATVFYQLGKSYVLAAIDPGFRTRVFEQALPVEETQVRGRGFVDGVVASGRERTLGVDWRQARKALNGRLERIQSPLEKGRRLLLEAIQADPSHEEARLYLGFLHAYEGKTLKAQRLYREVFDTAIHEENRGHAAMQLGKLHEREGDYGRCLVWFRWVLMSGLEKRDERFWGARFNVGIAWAMLGRADRALEAFRMLLDRHPTRAPEIARLFAHAPRLREAIESIPGFPERLLATCPELFESPATAAGGGNDSED